MAAKSQLKTLKHKTFAQLMSVEPVNFSQEKQQDDSPRYFKSLLTPYRPIISRGVFGGHVMAQSCYSASKTVPPGYVCHNLHGYFLLPGQQNQPFYYKVSVIRNGNNYKTRQVHVYQVPDGMEIDETILENNNNNKYLCYVAIMSFKRPSREPSHLTHQRQLPHHFSVGHKKSAIPNLANAPDSDIPVWIKLTNQDDYTIEEEKHPIDVRKLNMKAYHENIPVTERTQIHYFKHHQPLRDDPMEENDQNLHVAALIYISDRNSLFTIANVHDRKFSLAQVASIDHAFVLHRLDVVPRVDLDWMAMETFSSAAEDNRGLYQGHIYDHANRLLCSFMQDGVFKAYDAVSLEKEEGYYKECIEKEKRKIASQSKREKL